MHTETIARAPSAQLDPFRAGIARLRESGLILTDRQIADALAVRAQAPPTGISIMECWPVEGDGETLLVGRCPHCHRLHGYGFSRSPLRHPHCSTGGRFADPASKPPVYLWPVLEIPPEDLQFELGLDRRDLLELARQAGLRRWTRDQTRTALRAILRCGVLAERIAVRAIDGGIDERQARRDILASWIKRQNGRTMRERLRLSLLSAYLQSGRGHA